MMTRQHQTSRRPLPLPCRSAFTLIELLTVIAIIAIIAAMLWPAVGVISRATSTRSASQTVAIAVETARFIDTETAVPAKPVTITGALVPSFSIPWSGTAALFTASGQIRFLQCDQSASIASPPSGWNSIYLGDPNNQVIRHGYQDVPGRDYMTLPSPSGIVGIIRTVTGLHLITPPFAIRFNKAGTLVSADPDLTGANYPYDEKYMVYYDGNYDGTYGDISVPSVGSFYRPASYLMPSKAQLWNGTRYRTAFERIETVIGVVLFNPVGLDLTGDTNGYVNANAQTAIFKQLQNAHTDSKVLLFNRYTGAPIRKLSHE